MAENQEENMLEKLIKNQYAPLAGILLKNGDKGNARGALEQLADDLGYGAKDGFVQGAVVSDKGMQVAANNYSNVYSQAKEALTVEELKGFYEDTYSGLEDEDKEVFDNILGQQSKEKFGDITKKFRKADYILNGEENGYEFSDEEKKFAEDTLHKYLGVINLLNKLDSVKMNKLRPAAVNRADITSLTGLAKELKPFVKTPEREAKSE